MSIFRAYDIRGIVGKTLTPEIVKNIGQAIGSEAAVRGEQKVMVARDGRLSGESLLTVLIEGLVISGREVINIGMMPTPCLYFATYYLGTGSGVMLTGSHNPSDYNGLKIMLGGDTLANESIQRLKQRIDNNDYITGEGSVIEQDIQQAYIERIVSDINVTRPFKVVIDAGNGVAGKIAPELIRALGCDVIELYT